MQLDLMEGLVRRAFDVSDNPLSRRKLLYIVVKDDEGYALPPHLLEVMDELVKSLRG